jgi:DNA transformation protein
MNRLTDLPNIGPVAAEQLQRVGISAPATLIALGSVEAALRLEESGVSVCASKLAALEGAIRGVRWHSIPANERAALRKRFEAERHAG